MTFPRARVAVAALLLLGWLGFLLYLVIDSPRVILSTPQFLLAEAYVVASVSDANGAPSEVVTVDEVLWAKSDELSRLAKKTVRLADLFGCGKSSGYVGAGKYVLPLRKSYGALEITPIPWYRGYQHGPPTHATLESAGLPPPHVVRRLPIGEALERKKVLADAGHRVQIYDEELRIYPHTAEVRSQVDKLIASK
ncbi:MAG: hypothetical protein FJ303_06710 [Planctomycetes bacterium]|nr:hypothetical protein [Planctomycetota bacterium]